MYVYTYTHAYMYLNAHMYVCGCIHSSRYASVCIDMSVHIDVYVDLLFVFVFTAMVSCICMYGAPTSDPYADEEATAPDQLQ